MAQRRAYVWTDTENLRDNNRGEREAPPNLPEMEETMGNNFHISFFSKPGAIKEHRIFLLQKKELKIYS